jgi:hypothetical protein
MMKLLLTAFVLLLPSLALARPPFIGGSCPHGFSRRGTFCVDAHAAIPFPLPPNATCARGWTLSGSYCVPRAGAHAAIPFPLPRQPQNDW